MSQSPRISVRLSRAVLICLMVSIASCQDLPIGLPVAPVGAHLGQDGVVTIWVAQTCESRIRSIRVVSPNDDGVIDDQDETLWRIEPAEPIAYRDGALQVRVGADEISGFKVVEDHVDGALPDREDLVAWIDYEGPGATMGLNDLSAGSVTDQRGRALTSDGFVDKYAESCS